MTSLVFLARELGLAGSIVTLRQRSFRQDALIWERFRRSPTKIYGSENIPTIGPGLITINHYFRPGFRAWWMTLAISASIPHEIHWVMTDAWTYPGKFLGLLRTRLSRLLFRRIARVYDFTSMPPMPPNPSETAERAQSVRRVLSKVKLDPSILIGLAPEGGDSSSGDLQIPPSGVGRFVLHLCQSGLTIYPVGIFEEGEQICLNFGSPYKPAISPDLSPDERDRAGSELVMSHIALLLPTLLRGAFAYATT